MSSSTTTPTGPTESCRKHQFTGFNVPYILSWQNSYKTGILFIETLVLFGAFSSTVSLRLFLRLSYSVIGLLSIVEIASSAVSGQREGLVSNYRPSRFLPVSDSVVNDIANHVSCAFRRVVLGIEQLIDARSPAQGLKLAAFLYVVHTLLGLFSLKTIALSSILLTFGLPPLYLIYKNDVDAAIRKAQSQACHEAKKVSDKVYAKLGPQIEQVKRILGPRGGFPGTANVSPVKDVPTAAAKPTAFTSTSTTQTTATPREATTTSTTTTSTTSTSASNAAHTAANTAANTAAHTFSGEKTSSVDPELFKNFDSVPTLTGNVPIDHAKLDAALSAEKAKFEGSLNGF